MQLLMIEPKHVRLRTEIDPRHGRVWVCTLKCHSVSDVVGLDMSTFGIGNTSPAAYLSMFRILRKQGWGLVVMKPLAREQSGDSPRARAF